MQVHRLSLCFCRCLSLSLSLYSSIELRASCMYIQSFPYSTHSRSEVFRFDVNDAPAGLGNGIAAETRQVFHVNWHQCDVALIVSQQHGVCWVRVGEVQLNIRDTARRVLQRTDYMRLLQPQTSDVQCHTSSSSSVVKLLKRRCRIPKFNFKKTIIQEWNGKSAQRDANTARALAVVRFGHRPRASQRATNKHTQTGPITIHCAAS